MEGAGSIPVISAVAVANCTPHGLQLRGLILPTARPLPLGEPEDHSRRGRLTLTQLRADRSSLEATVGIPRWVSAVAPNCRTGSGEGFLKGNPGLVRLSVLGRTPPLPAQNLSSEIRPLGDPGDRTAPPGRSPAAVRPATRGSFPTSSPNRPHVPHKLH